MELKLGDFSHAAKLEFDAENYNTPMHIAPEFLDVEICDLY